MNKQDSLVIERICISLNWFICGVLFATWTLGYLKYWWGVTILLIMFVLQFSAISPPILILPRGKMNSIVHKCFYPCHLMKSKKCSFCDCTCHKKGKK